MIADLLFMMFASVLLMAATGVILARNPMYCVLFLIVCFFNSAGLFLLLGAEFLGLLLVMVYVGAVAVMFLFVLMTINVDFCELKEGFANYLPSGVLIGGVLLAEVLMAAWGGLFASDKFVASSTLPMVEGEQNIVTLGSVLFTNYALPFQASALILLTAMVGAIVLTHRRRSVKRQNIFDQISRKREDALEIVKIKPGQGVK